jgi:putative transposase
LHLFPASPALYENYVIACKTSVFARMPMGRLFQPLLVYLSVATDRELARQIQFLKEENRILRDRLPKRITVTPRERRRLLKYGRGLGKAIRELITIVTPKTFARWLSGERESKKSAKPKRKLGRPKTPDEVRDLILRIAGETGWGTARILGGLTKLGVRVARSTVSAILLEHGFDPGPKRGEGTWSEFVARHAETLWATDFFSKKVWTTCGLVDVFVLFFIHIGSRRVHVAGITTNPDGAWMAQQARNMSMVFADEPVKPSHLIMDMDTKFTAQFRQILESDGIEMVRVGPRKPNLNAHAERFVQSVKTECLDHFVCFGVDHLRHIVNRFVNFYNRRRPHQGRNNRTLPAAAGDEPDVVPFSSGRVECESDLGGLLRHYYRQAA